VTHSSGTPIYQVSRLGPSDRERAGELFALMANVFEEERAPLGDAYLQSILANPTFFALAAFHDNTLVGGATAHVLPMTRAAHAELFLYDIATHPDHQRRGVGRALLDSLRRHAHDAGINQIFVLADEEDTHALDFYQALGGVPSRVVLFTLGEDK